MSDKNNTPKPDRASADDHDVPTYNPDKLAQSQPTKDITKDVPDTPAKKSTGGSTRASTTGAPTTGTSAGGTGRTGEDLYTRTGRAAPQNIPPKQNTPPRGDSAARPGVSGAETTAFAAPGPDRGSEGVNERNSEPLRSDAPTTAFDPADQPRREPAQEPARTPSSDYADTDFAPTAGGGTNFAQPGAEQPTMHQPMAAPAAAGGATAAGAAGVAGAAGAADHDAEFSRGEAADERREHRRGTIDWGILLLRLLLGVVLVLTSVATFFQLGDTPGLADLEAEYAAYTIPQILAIAVPSVQLAAGVFLIFGLITPLFAALATIVTSFTALHALTDSGAGLNVFAWDDSVMLPVVLLGISLVLQFTGPGLYSFDFGRRWARRPLASSWIFVVLALAGAVALWWFGAGVNPLN